MYEWLYYAQIYVSTLNLRWLYCTLSTCITIPRYLTNRSWIRARPAVGVSTVFHDELTEIGATALKV